MSISCFARNAHPKIRCANLGPRFALPIPAPAARPLTKGALLQTWLRGREHDESVERNAVPLLPFRSRPQRAEARSTGAMETTKAAEAIA